MIFTISARNVMEEYVAKCEKLVKEQFHEIVERTQKR
jgi:hypothetical protein